MRLYGLLVPARPEPGASGGAGRASADGADAGRASAGDSSAARSASRDALLAEDDPPAPGA